jgi:hypothetical protein
VLLHPKEANENVMTTLGDIKDLVSEAAAVDLKGGYQLLPH